ncbi:hypothetical protein J7F03_05505 [Streptomyces sp. ISL-43]|uniref:hypothetical protein n=1 Tax=Streptomyces sp. ISL-43 TaxID=2819183 RepID=UPI001BE5FBFD|nr:hypothetical protein [Streptomyces sp. ISL-43]MBT2446546.1 hypothetical protein [Streptomyces sp. ISL-43]
MSAVRRTARDERSAPRADGVRGVRRALTAALLVGGGLLGVAASPSPSPSPSGGAQEPTEAGTAFRTATPVRLGQEATADASTGDYLYWVLPLDSGQRATVKASVTLPAATGRHAASTWQLDVYDGLRRRQPCMYGTQTGTAAKDAATIDLSCTLRPVRSGADQWGNDPLKGAYYIRLTVTDLAQEDLGQPVRARLRAEAKDVGGAYAADNTLAAPLVPGAGTAAGVEPEGGWSGAWWSDRWLWTAAGGLLAALAGIGGYRLTRGAGRPGRVPPGT